MELPPEPAVAAKPDNVPCAGPVTMVHVSVCPASGSETVSNEVISPAPEFSHMPDPCRLPPVKEGGMLPPPVILIVNEFPELLQVPLLTVSTPL